MSFTINAKRLGVLFAVCLVWWANAIGPQRLAAQTLPQTNTVTAPDLLVQLEVDTLEAKPGDTLSYTIRFRNRGTATAQNVVVRALAPNHSDSRYFTFFHSTTPLPSEPSGITFGDTARVLVWNIGTLPPAMPVSDTRTLTFKIWIDENLNESKFLTTLATIKSDEFGPSEVAATVDVFLQPAIVIKKSVVSLPFGGTPDYCYGRPIEFSIVVRDTGDQTVDEVLIYDKIPSQATVFSSVPPVTETRGDSIFWRVGPIQKNGGQFTIKYWLIFDAPSEAPTLRQLTNIAGGMLDEIPLDVDSVTVEVGVCPPCPPGEVCPDSLLVNLSQISLSDNLRAVSAQFPDPIFSYVTAIDLALEPRFGLAHSTDWLSPSQPTEIGLLVSDIWQPIREVHLEDRSIPADPVVSDFMITEVRGGEGGFSVAFVMDYNSSLFIADLDSAKAAVRQLIDRMSADDRAAIIRFGADVEIAQEFTNDPVALRTALDSPLSVSPGGRALYDAIEAATTRAANLQGRKAVVVYTNGVDDASSTPRDQMITSALKSGVPVYTIGLGGAPAASLQEIADRSGGEYLASPGNNQLRSSYVRVAQWLQHYYVLAYASPDSRADGTWREVKVSVELSDISASDSLSYLAPADKALMVNVSQVSVSAGDIVRGTEAEFPNHVLSYTTAADEQRRPISGLATASGWISQSAMTDSGGSVTDIWQTVQEYHRADPAVPSNPMVSEFMITEIQDGEEGVSVAFVMDYSSTATSYAAEAETAVRDFVNQMTGLDQTAIIKFGAETELIQEFTSDQTALLAGVVQPLSTSPEGKVLYDALEMATTATQPLGGRKAIVVYTDGANMGGSLGVDQLNDIVEESGVPIYAIRVGGSVETELQQAAIASGGEFVLAPTTGDLGRQLAQNRELIRNYYVLDHASTDPQPDGTVRVVDVTVRSMDLEANDTGLYQAPIEFNDVAVSKTSITERVCGTDPNGKFVADGDRYQYSITVTNLASSTASSITVTDELPPNISVENPTPSDVVLGADTAVWTINELAPGATLDITFDAVVNDLAGATQLVNTVRVDVARDTVMTNNTARDTVTVVAAQADPAIEVSRSIDGESIIEPMDSVAVNVTASYEVTTWDIVVKFANGTVDSTYGDEFIRANPILPVGVPVLVEPVFTDTKFRTNDREETIVFELHTQDACGFQNIVTDDIALRSNNDFKLAKNVFRPEGEPIEILFKLSSNRDAELRVLDIAGHVIKDLGRQAYSAGWNTLLWSGTNNNDRPVGAGVYVVTIESGDLRDFKKFIIVR